MPFIDFRRLMWFNVIEFIYGNEKEQMIWHF